MELNRLFDKAIAEASQIRRFGTPAWSGRQDFLKQLISQPPRGVTMAQQVKTLKDLAAPFAAVLPGQRRTAWALVNFAVQGAKTGCWETAEDFKEALGKTRQFKAVVNAPDYEAIIRAIMALIAAISAGKV